VADQADLALGSCCRIHRRQAQVSSSKTSGSSGAAMLFSARLPGFTSISKPTGWASAS